MTLVQVREYTDVMTQFGGASLPTPHIETLPHVDVAALTIGDDDPFYVTLQISEVGRISKNKVEYDEELVSTIEREIRNGGVEGLMGHLPDEAVETAYPFSDDSSTPLAGFWVGVQRVGEILWGKAYIPPGKVRDYMRRVKAIGGKLGVSFYGKARVEVANGIRRFRDFSLETLDFAPHKRASLTLAGDFEVTSETEKPDIDDKGGDMPEPITLENVPQVVREQLHQQWLKESKADENAQRVSELEQQVQAQEETIREMREYGRIVTEISTQVGDGVDIIEWVREMNETMVRIGEILGTDVNIVTRIEEYHISVMEMAQERFDHALTAQVAEMTNWNATTDDGKSKLEALRKNFTKQILVELGDERDMEKIAEIANAVWESDDFQIIAESVRDALAGPPAFVHGKQVKTSDFKETMKSPEAQKSLKARYGIR